jgi:hypothetical protein
VIIAGQTYFFTKSGNEVRAVEPAQPYRGQPCLSVVRTLGISAGKGMIVPARALAKSLV